MIEDEGKMEERTGWRESERRKRVAKGRLDFWVDSIVKKGKFQGGEGRKAKRASLGEVEGSMSG